jgi:hypothetical protein
MERLDLGPGSLKKFGLIMGGVFAFVSAYVFLRRHEVSLPMMGLCGVFIGAGLFASDSLKPVFIVWMRLASVLAWVNTRLILILAFYLVFVPIGFIMRIAGKDLLKRTVEKSAASYWIRHPKKAVGLSEYERMF